MQASQRTGFSGSTLSSLLARLSGRKSGLAGGVGGADRLSQWFTWTDAIALAAALDGAAVVRVAGAWVDAGAAAAECAQVHRALADAIAHDCAPKPAAARSDRSDSPAIDGDAAPPADFAPLRRIVIARQQAMQESIGRLRERLREKLAGASPENARLAAIDAVMEQVLGLQERECLAGIPAQLQKGFERLRDAATDAPTSDERPAAPGSAPDWRDTFRLEMHAVLLAELDLRFQPVEGLLEALRTTSLKN